jgi:NADP-dependent 3-hydroxy acid dehydrogenase YdfG
MTERVILITRSSGIAAATAEHAVHSGDRVFVVNKSNEECAQLCAHLGNSGFYVADASDEREFA